MTDPQQPADRIEAIMRQVAQVSPVADLTSKELCMRLQRVAHHLETHLRRELSAFGIEPWELELLASLRRSGPPYQVTAGVLQDSMQLTTGAVTKRVAALERKGWVRREVVPEDRRQVLVCLTPEGEKRALDVFLTKTRTESQALASLDGDTQRRLNRDLKTLLLALEGPAPGSGSGRR
ncbi:MarR family transcriptional regulator [Streptomyces sp. NPDC049099]|uniref:MarR family winged helix-turn-helix transcriptional regulator n=1 Tax=unclassified Streptomyces TaxID=2593676 RepID=UPI0034439091